MKDILTELKKIMLECKNTTFMKKNDDLQEFRTEDILDQKIEAYFEWYRENILKHYCREEERENEIEKLKKLIYKFVAWYEIRYPDYDLGDKIPFPYSDDSKKMNEILKEEKQVSDEFDWATFYDKKVFLKSLSRNEKRLISGNRYYTYYTTFLWFQKEGDLFGRINLEISKKMNVVYTSILALTGNNNFHLKKDLQGKSIDEAIDILKTYGYHLEDDSDISLQYQKNLRENSHKIFDTIMYSMMRSGGRYAGPRRALLFAKEFKLNLDIPMSYGVIMDDEDTLYLIDEYLKNNGHEDLVCYVNQKIMTLEEVINYLLNQEPSFEVKRELSVKKYDLLKRLVTSLNSQISSERLEKEKIKKNRIQRKICQDK